MNCYARFYIAFASLIIVKANTHLGESCVDNWSCSHIVNAGCSNGICSCVSNTVEHDGECVLVSYPEKSCTIDADCKEVTDERKICVSNKCRCIPYHHVIGVTCAKNRGLRESCQSNDDCYWGQDMIDKMECQGKCSCKSGFRPFHGRKCVSAANGIIFLPIMFIFTAVSRIL